MLNRDYFWKNGLHGFNLHNVDAYAVSLHSTDELIQYIASMSLYCVERNGKYINFSPTPLRQYFSAKSILGECYDGIKYRQIAFTPKADDLKYLRSFKFEDLTYRGTIEFRSVCMQPVSEIMSAAAFHAGLIENLSALTELLEQDTVIYQRGYNVIELRDLFSRKELPAFVDKDALSVLLLHVLELAKDGLYNRGFNEEIYLKSLYFRAEHLLSPARQMTAELENGKSLDDCIIAYAQKEKR